MHEHFTDRIRRVMELANQEAKRLDNECIDTEHILRGLVCVGGGVAADVLEQLGVQLHAMTLEIEKFEQRGNPETCCIGKLPKSPRAMKVIYYAIDEARQLGEDSVGTEHFLLGLLREDEGFAAQVLMNFGVRLEQVRTAIQAIPRRSDDEGSK